jgi:hypothetical protein
MGDPDDDSANGIDLVHLPLGIASSGKAGSLPRISNPQAELPREF